MLSFSVVCNHSLNVTPLTSPTIDDKPTVKPHIQNVCTILLHFPWDILKPVSSMLKGEKIYQFAKKGQFTIMCHGFYHGSKFSNLRLCVDQLLACLIWWILVLTAGGRHVSHSTHKTHLAVGARMRCDCVYLISCVAQKFQGCFWKKCLVEVYRRNPLTRPRPQVIWQIFVSGTKTKRVFFRMDEMFKCLLFPFMTRRKKEFVNQGSTKILHFPVTISILK